jgi:hypothetical protein
MLKLLLLFLSISSVLYAENSKALDEIQIHIAPDDIQGAPSYRTMQQAIDYSYEATSQSVSSIKFLIHEGTYNQQAAVLRPKQGIHYEFTSASNGEQLPNFDGELKQLTWLRVLSAHGTGSSVYISKLKIKNYITAISIEGDREDPTKYNAQNKIFKMQFENIGQTSLGFPPSTAVVRLVNSRNNEIFDNDFTNIKNVENCGLLHSVYLAHHSSGNLIERNNFTNLCGSPIRVRDDSNNNNALHNKFNNIQNGKLMDQWFCDKSSRKDCTKSNPELRSHSNALDTNRIAP